MIGEIIPKMLSLLLLPIMTRYLTPADYGVIAYVDAIIIFVFVFSLMSLNSYILREYFQLKEITEQKKMIGNFFLTLVCYNIVSLFIFIGLLSFLFSVLELQFNFFPIMLLALLANFFEIFSIFPQIIYRIQQKAIIYILYCKQNNSSNGEYINSFDLFRSRSTFKVLWSTGDKYIICFSLFLYY